MMGPAISSEIMTSAVELACYFFTAVAAVVGFLLTGR
jgi:hypothetical protein